GAAGAGRGRLRAAGGLSRAGPRRPCEGPGPPGSPRRAAAAEWGLPAGIVVAAGGGDAAAGAVGIGAVEDGDAFISLGTSAQFFVTRDRYDPKPATLVHAFAHALPGRWFEMAAMLNGATVLDFAARLLGAGDIGALLRQVEARFTGPSPVTFLPYLSGERTPHDDPDVRAAFVGLDAATGAVDLAQAVLDGLVFSLMDAQRALGQAGLAVGSLSAVGGGARSRFWLRLIASGLRLPIRIHAGADKGPAFGAARLARMAASGESAAEVCVKPLTVAVIEPDGGLAEIYGARFATYRALYPAIRRPPVRRPSR
nr:FGGY-family carbohydrate kinase [Bauldia sp.]